MAKASGTKERSRFLDILIKIITNQMFIPIAAILILTIVNLVGGPIIFCYKIWY